jgi:Flp pilus assembly protein TadD
MDLDRDGPLDHHRLHRGAGGPVVRGGAGPDPSARSVVASERGDWAGAERAAREDLKLLPDDPAKLRALARSSTRLGRDDAAIALYSRPIDERAMEVEDNTLLGLALRRRGRPDAADRAWEKAMEVPAIRPGALEELARVFLDSHRREEAARAAERLARARLGGPRGDDARHRRRRAR